MDDAADKLIREVNRLYWTTALPVTELADQLSISRRGLYAMLAPEPAGKRCPECGAHLGFRNRSARTAGEAECSECGLEVDATAFRDLPDEAAAAASATAPEPELEREAVASGRSPVDTADALRRDRALTLAGAAIAGAAAGALAAFLGTRR
jgi:hypothetical protein